MLRAWRTFFRRFHITRGVCMLLLVFGLAAVAGCSSETAPQNKGTEAANTEKMTRSCWTCPMFTAAYRVAMDASGKIVPQVSRSAIGLVGVGYALWLAVFILKYVASLQEPDVGSFWKTLGVQTFWVLMGTALLRDLASGGGASAIKMFAEPVFSGFVNAGLAIVQGTSDVPCAPGGSGGSGLECLVNALQQKLNFSAGISAVAIFMGPSVFVVLVGVIVFIVSVILMIYLPLLLLDTVFRYAIALCMLPLAVTAYIFTPTRSFTGKVAKLFTEIGFYVVIMCAFAAACVQIISAYIDRFLPFVKNPLIFLGNVDALERVLFGPGITGLIFLCFFLVLFGGVIADFSKALSGGAGGMGNNVRGAAGAVKNAAALAKKVANLGINKVKRAKDKKAARDLESKDEDSKEYKEAARRLQNRGYLAKGKDGRLHATQSYDNLTRNDHMKGPMKGVRRMLNNMADLRTDWNQGVMDQSFARHDHEANKVSSYDHTADEGTGDKMRDMAFVNNKMKLEDAAGETGREVVRPDFSHKRSS